MRDAAYESVLIRDRQRLHRTVAERLGDQAPAQVLAEHWSIAQAWEPALRSWHRAIDQAATEGAFGDAIKLVYRAKGLFSRLPRTRSVERARAAIELLHAEVLQTTRGWGHPETCEVAGEALALASNIGDTMIHVRSLAMHVVHHAVRSEPDLCLEYARDAMRVAEASRDSDAYLSALGSMAVAHFHAHKPREAMEFVRRARALDPALFTMRKYEIWLLLGQGRYERALALAKERLELHEALGRPLGICDSLWVLADAYWHRGEAEELLSVAERMHALCVEYDLGPHLRAMASEHQARALVRLGRASEAIPYARAGTEAMRETGSYQRGLACQGVWISALVQAGHRAEAEALAADRMRRADASTLTGLRTFACFSAAEVLSHNALQPSELLPGDVTDYLEEAMASPAFERSPSYALRLALAYAPVLRDRQRREEALAMLEGVYARFSEGFDAPHLRQAKALINELRL